MVCKHIFKKTYAAKDVQNKKKSYTFYIHNRRTSMYPK